MKLRIVVFVILCFVLLLSRWGRFLLKRYGSRVIPFAVFFAVGFMLSGLMLRTGYPLFADNSLLNFAAQIIISLVIAVAGFREFRKIVVSVTGDGREEV